MQIMSGKSILFDCSLKNLNSFKLVITIMIAVTKVMNLIIVHLRHVMKTNSDVIT